MNPEVSVIMSVCNGERFLREAVESVLTQSFSNFELIIVDDGSTDGTSTILKDTVGRDSRIVLLRNTENIGLTKSLNMAVRSARGQYVARQDADDVSMPLRFSRQLDFLKSNPSVGVLGTSVEVVNESGSEIGKFLEPFSHGMCAWTLVFANCFAHPSVMMRRSEFEKEGGYNPSFKFSQDYELWCRMVGATRFANLTECLIRYRATQRGISIRHRSQQEAWFNKARQQFFSRLLERNVDMQIIEWLSESQRPHGLLAESQIGQVIHLLHELHLIYGDKILISEAERGEVRADLEHRISAAKACSPRPLRRIRHLLQRLRSSISPALRPVLRSLRERRN